VHQEEVEFPNVIDKEFLEAVGEEMAGLFVTSVADLWHGSLTAKPTSNPVVNTLWFPPCFLHTMVAIRLVTLEFVCALLDDGDLRDHGGLQVERRSEHDLVIEDTNLKKVRHPYDTLPIQPTTPPIEHHLNGTGLFRHA